MSSGFKKIIILYAWFITLVFNKNLLIYFFDNNAFLFQNVYFIVALFITIALVIKIFLFTFGQRYLLKPVTIFLLILSSIVYYFQDKFKVLVNEDIIISTFDTFLEGNVNELNELLTFNFIATVLVLGVLPSIFLIKIKINYPDNIFKEILQRGFIIGLCFGFLGLIVFSNYKNVSLIARKNEKINRVIIPTYTISSIKNLYKKYYLTPSEVKIFVKKATAVQDLKRNIMILVLGETARSDRFSLGGYERETNPRLKEIGVQFYKNVESCGTITAYSVPCIFYLDKYSSYSPAKARYQQNVLDVVNMAPNHKVIWLENNSSCKHVCDRIETLDYMNLKKDEYNPGQKDEYLIGETKKVLDKYNKEKNLLIVLHTMGSHGPRYHNRYPKEFEKFKPACNSNSPEKCETSILNNSYDNTIYYTDHVIAELIGLLKKYETQTNIGLFYVSDHGESLGENGIYLHGLPKSFAPKEQTHVPFIWWSNKLTAGKNEVIEDQLTFEDVPGKLLSFFNIKTEPELKLKNRIK